MTSFVIGGIVARAVAKVLGLTFVITALFTVVARSLAALTARQAFAAAQLSRRLELATAVGAIAGLFASALVFVIDAVFRA